MINLVEGRRSVGQQRYFKVMAVSMLGLELKINRAYFPTSIVRLTPRRRHPTVRCTDQQPLTLHRSEVLS